MTTNRTKTPEGSDLGMGLLVAEFESGVYIPVAAVATISEAREIAAGDLRQRTNQPSAGGAAASPSKYRVWARSWDGEYRSVAEIKAA